MMAGRKIKSLAQSGTIRPESLLAALDLKERELISLVGAGGKTSLMFALARDLQDQGKKVISSTTTKIFHPRPEESPKIIVGGIDAFKEVESSLARFGHITWAAEAIVDNKLSGISLAELSELWSRGVADYLIVEADGSAQKPVKAPNEYEPVVPEETTLFLSVIGLSALGQPLTSEFAFRPERISGLTAMDLNSPMTIEGLARLMAHPEGGLKGYQPSMRALVFLNQSDQAPSPQSALQLARAVKEKGRGIISRVLVGQLKHPLEKSPHRAALPSLLVLQ
jgi:probable selenium-dependent hydroxylase accessory protein YqeC